MPLLNRIAVLAMVFALACGAFYQIILGVAVNSGGPSGQRSIPYVLHGTRMYLTPFEIHAADVSGDLFTYGVVAFFALSALIIVRDKFWPRRDGSLNGD
jgi:hypothetical protein